MDIKKIMSKMTFEEKAELLTGGSALNTASFSKYGINNIALSDGPHGVRRVEGETKREVDIKGGQTCFPTASAIGATWNLELAYETGRRIAKDCRENGVDVILGPGINMKRTPHCGRNFEYFSEDPYLSGRLAAEYINGVQNEGVGTSLKHFAANNQETLRFSINAEIDERTLREYYLRGFEIALKYSEPTSVMCSYNKINGIWASENKFLLDDILRKEWNYDGMVISDWGAVHNISKCIKAGLDLEMPQNKNIVKQLKEGMEKGIIINEDIDRAVESVLKFVDRINNMHTENKSYDRMSQHESAYNVAKEAITMLKNENDTLPVTSNKYKKIAVVGKNAAKPVYKGGGSSCASNSGDIVDIPCECIKNNAEGIKVEYFSWFDYEFLDGTVAENTAKFRDYDLVLLFIGDNYGADAETEAFDRDNLKLPNYVNAAVTEMIKNDNLVIILQTGSAVIPHRWDGARAILQMWYSGEACGRAIADVLFGKVNPSGKLSETYPLIERYNLNYPSDLRKVEYLEKWESGYRYYDKHKDEVWYPFGHGISYTTFEYLNLRISDKKINTKKFEVRVTLDVKNTGLAAGKEVVQLYISAVDSIVAMPVKQLVGFSKIHLEAGETKTVSFELDERSFSYYNVCLKEWHVESGKYEIIAAASSDDIRLKEEISICYDSDYTR